MKKRRLASCGILAAWLLAIILCPLTMTLLSYGDPSYPVYTVTSSKTAITVRYVIPLYSPTPDLRDVGRSHLPTITRIK